MRKLVRSAAWLAGLSVLVAASVALVDGHRRPNYAAGYTQQPTSADALHIRPGGYWRCSQQATWPHEGKMCGLAYMVYPNDRKILIRYRATGLFETSPES